MTLAFSRPSRAGPQQRGEVRKPLSTSTPASPKERKKSARPYGSTIALDADFGSAGLRRAVLHLVLAATARKFPITEMLGLK